MWKLLIVGFNGLTVCVARKLRNILIKNHLDKMYAQIWFDYSHLLALSQRPVSDIEPFHSTSFTYINRQI